MASQSPVRILVVDDDEDTRDLITFALQGEGYAVTPARDGPSALDALRAGRFELVITDYDMPGQTGAEMLKAAAREDLLGEASALVVTAHPEPEGVPEETPLLRKPIDLERLLRQVRTILPSLAAAKPKPKAKVKAKKADAAASDGTLIDLVLYVSERSPASLRARQRMNEVLAGFDAARVRFEVCDLLLHAASAERDRVVFTPTLLKRAPAPRSWILGDLADDEVVRDLLAMCGVPPRNAEKGTGS
jgi:CheY-like chemotaxis protein